MILSVPACDKRSKTHYSRNHCIYVFQNQHSNGPWRWFYYMILGHLLFLRTGTCLISYDSLQIGDIIIRKGITPLKALSLQLPHWNILCTRWWKQDFQWNTLWVDLGKEVVICKISIFLNFCNWVREIRVRIAAHPANYAHTWWRHQKETFSAALALCAWNSPVTGEFPSQWRGALMFSLISTWKKSLSKQSWG